LCIVADATALYIQPAAQWAVPGARFWGVGGGGWRMQFGNLVGEKNDKKGTKQQTAKYI